MSSVTRLLTTKLKLRVNSEKSAVARPWNGNSWVSASTITSHEEAPRPENGARFKERVRELTRRTRGISLVRMVHDLTEYLRGWIGYFGRCENPEVLDKLENGSDADFGQWSGNSGNGELRDIGELCKRGNRCAGCRQNRRHLRWTVAPLANTPALKKSLCPTLTFASLGLPDLTALGLVNPPNRRMRTRMSGSCGRGEWGPLPLCRSAVPVLRQARSEVRKPR